MRWKTDRFRHPGASLSGAWTSGADLRRADLRLASLFDANLSEAEYDSTTKWSEGFDPKAAGAVLVED